MKLFVLLCLFFNVLHQIQCLISFNIPQARHGAEQDTGN